MSSPKLSDIKMEEFYNLLNENKESDHNNLCRTCLGKEILLHSIFDVSIRTYSLDFIISATTGLKIEQNDGLPTTVCSGCKDKAEEAFDFKRMSQESDMILQGILRREKFDDPNAFEMPEDTSSHGNMKLEQLATDNIDYYNADHPDDYEELNSAGDIKTEFQNHELPCILSEKKPTVEEVKKEKLEEKDMCGDAFSIKSTRHNIVECGESDTFCPICGVYYENSHILRNHMWTHHAPIIAQRKRGRPKKILTDPNLSREPQSKELKNAPKTKISPVNLRSCVFCKRRYKTTENLLKHIQQHKDTRILSCILCKKMYLDKSSFELHMCSVEKDSMNERQGDISDITVWSENNHILKEVLLLDLYPDNNFKDLHVCNVCNAMFLFEDDLIKHSDDDHPELSKRCNKCQKVFASVRTAARHRMACKQIERKHTCETCGLKFPYEISLNKHILRYHEGKSVSLRFIDSKSKLADRQYQCDTCKKCFYRKELLIKHSKIHMPNEMSFECDVCQKKFHRKDNLRSHKRVHELHRENQAQNNCLCLYCGRSFSNSSNLIVHIRRHTGEKPYKCDFCGKGFPRSSDLQCHRRSHTGEKPCVCVICGKGFSRSNKLSRHMRVHTGLKPYKCTYCGRAFSQSNDLTLHVRRHTGDKPYICEVCGARFIQGTALQNHKRGHNHLPEVVVTESQLDVDTISFDVSSELPNN